MPAPTPDALAHSARVVAHIEKLIADSGGWISFADYMGAALYAPGLGYYVRGRAQVRRGRRLRDRARVDAALFGKRSRRRSKRCSRNSPGSS